MKQAFGLVRRPWGVFYLKHKITGEQKSLKTSDKVEAQRILQAHNESECQPHFNLSLARVYLNGADPKLATRTWQEVMENIVTKKTDETRRRWDTAIKDRNFDCIRNLRVAETRPEHFDRALADGKVSTNVYLRRIHNHALGMEWLLKSVMRSELFAKLMTMPMSFFNQTKFGRIISRMTSDIDSVRAGVQDVAFVLVVQGLQMTASAALMAWYDWKLFSLMVLLVPVIWLVNENYRQEMSRRLRKVQESWSRVASTLAESVSGSGQVLVDGLNLNQVNSDSLRSQMGSVQQNNFLFSGSVLDNIRFARPKATEADVRATLAALDCLDLLDALPQKLHTRVAERGTSLSFGQRQLVCFARALLVNPRIVVLDEATSAIDSVTEARLQRALDILLRGRTAFVVAHRLSTIRKADLVLVMDQGRIVERGTHESLLHQAGIYARLHQEFVSAQPEQGTTQLQSVTDHGRL
jgi:ATP-binding cassette subfamily B protein